MSVVAVGTTEAEVNRRPLDQVLGVASGPSRRGSTYWSRVLACPFEHLLANVLGYRPKHATVALDTGVLWHTALEAFYRSRLARQDHYRRLGPVDLTDDGFFHDAVPAHQAAAFAAVAPVATEPGYEQIYKTLEAMLDAYFERWQHERWEIVDVETTIESPDPNLEYTARLDLIVIDHATSQPMLRVVEHKSTYRVDSFVLDGYTLDLQTLGQAWLAWNVIKLEAYPPFGGLVINVTSKETTPKTERVMFYPTPAALESFERAMRSFQRLPLLYEEMGYPRNFAACTRRYGRCQFFNLCRNKPEWDAQTMIAMRQDAVDTRGFVR